MKEIIINNDINLCNITLNKLHFTNANRKYFKHFHLFTFYEKCLIKL